MSVVSYYNGAKLKTLNSIQIFPKPPKNKKTYRIELWELNGWSRQGVNTVGIILNNHIFSKKRVYFTYHYLDWTFYFPYRLQIVLLFIITFSLIIVIYY